MDHETALEWAAQDDKVQGLAEKAKTGRYALRFSNLDDYLEYAKAHNMEGGTPGAVATYGITSISRRHRINEAAKGPQVEYYGDPFF